MRPESRPEADNLRTNPLLILDPGTCEPFKALVHGAALGLTALMGAYNAAAWIRRRQRHLAINAVIYLAAAFWEQRHVAHHLSPCLPGLPVTPAAEPGEKGPVLVKREAA